MIKSKLVANANICPAFASWRVNPHFHAAGKWTLLRNSVQFFASPKPMGQHPSFLRCTLVPVLDYIESDHEKAKKCCRCRIMKCFWDKIKYGVCRHRPRIFFCYLIVRLFTNAIYPPLPLGCTGKLFHITTGKEAPNANRDQGRI